MTGAPAGGDGGQAGDDSGQAGDDGGQVGGDCGQAGADGDHSEAVETLLAEASRLVADEADHIDEKLTAFDRFAAGVGQLSTATGPQGGVGGSRTEGIPGSVSAAVGHTGGGDDRIATVRSLFAETVRPYSIEDVGEPEPLLVTIQEELTPEIAVALAPSSGQTFTPELKGAISSAVDQSRAELEAMERGLAVEETAIERASELEASITEFDADQPSPLTLDFEALSRRHEQFETFREQCEGLAADRQSTLHRTTNHAVSADISHWLLVEYLYQPLAVEYPVLSAATRLIDRCERRQRTLRDHLTRTV